MGTDVDDRRVVPGVERVPAVPDLEVISSSPRCVETTGHEKAAVHPRFVPNPLKAGFLWPEGSSLPLSWLPLLP